MIRVTLKSNWKQIFDESDVQKIIVVEISGGCVQDITQSEWIPGLKVVIIDHDDLEEEIPYILEKFGFKYSEKIYDKIIDIMKLTGDDAETVIESIINLK